MTKQEDLWLESRVRSRVEGWCHELGWECVPKAWCCEIRPAGQRDDVYAEWKWVCGVASVGLLLPIDPWPRHLMGPWPVEILQFVLRRNAEKAHSHWCITRHEGLSLLAVRDFETFTLEAFRDLATYLLEERTQLLTLAEKEPAPDGSDKPVMTKRGAV